MPANFCEASLCAWVRQPGNTWSNVGFLVAAFFIWRATRAPRSHQLRGLAWALAAMGIGSAFFHASETLVGEWVDYAGMYVGTAFMLMVVVRRAFGSSRLTQALVFWGFTAAGMSTLLLDDVFVRPTFMVANLLCPIFEIALFARRSTRAKSYRWLWAAYAVFLPAVALWRLDLNGMLCNPQNHVLSGHGMWHLLDALMFWFSFLYYRQFDSPTNEVA